MNLQPEKGRFSSGPASDSEIFDTKRWPIVVIPFPEIGMPNRARRLLEGLGQLLDQRQRFVIIWIPARHGHDSEPQEDERRAAIWTKQRKNDLKDFCAGYIYMTTDSEVRASLLEMFPKVEKLMPFPKALAESEAEAFEKAVRLLASFPDAPAPHG